MKKGYLHLTAIAGIDMLLWGQGRPMAKSRQQSYFKAKCPDRKNKKEITMAMFDEDGWSTLLGCSVYTKRKPKTFMMAPS